MLALKDFKLLGDALTKGIRNIKNQLTDKDEELTTVCIDIYLCCWFCCSFVYP